MNANRIVQNRTVIWHISLSSVVFELFIFVNHKSNVENFQEIITEEFPAERELSDSSIELNPDASTDQVVISGSDSTILSSGMKRHGISEPFTFGVIALTGPAGLPVHPEC